MNESLALPTDGKCASDNIQTNVKDVSCLPDFKVLGCYSSDMVLQRRKPVRIAGVSNKPGMKVEGVFDGEKSSCTVDENGRFELTFSPREATKKPLEMVVRCPLGETKFTDVLIGDVWFIGGQSNGEHCFAGCLGDTPELTDYFNEDMPLRLFRQTQAFAVNCKEHFGAPSYDVVNPEWRWQKSSSEACHAFSAIGIYTAYNMMKSIDVPLGFVMMCPGGACLSELMPSEIARSLKYEFGGNVPVGGYYNTLIAPFITFPFYGQIFYQGESEGIWRDRALQYDKELKILVDDERKTFGNDFPFYNVQLASYRSEGEQFFPNLQIVRMNQYKASKKIKNSHIAVNRDNGARPEDGDWAHSPHKSAIGKRLANQILKYEYNVKISEPVESPWPTKITLLGDKIIVKFSNVGTGLVNKSSDPLKGFSLFVNDNENIFVDAEITSKNEVTVSLPEGMNDVPENSKLCYALISQATTENAGLFGGSGLPVGTFGVKV